MNKALGYWLAFCFLIISGHASADDRVPVVWDGFAYPYKPGAPEKCDEKLNPSSQYSLMKNTMRISGKKLKKLKMLNINLYHQVMRQETLFMSLYRLVWSGLLKALEALTTNTTSVQMLSYTVRPVIN